MADTAESIVRSLAATEPSDSEGYACGVCLRVGATERSDTEAHPAECPWRRAVEWVAAHP